MPKGCLDKISRFVCLNYKPSVVSLAAANDTRTAQRGWAATRDEGAAQYGWAATQEEAAA